jgi:hypothetical protein
MKTITKIRMALLLSSVAFSTPVFANASNNEPIATTNSNNPTSTEAKAKAEVLNKRLEEIKAIDKSDLTRIEKKELRKEVREIKSTLKASGNGVYLSIGAIIIIVLLLILLL